jgi:hypothetical protein
MGVPGKKKFSLKDIIFVTVTPRMSRLFSLLGKTKRKTRCVVCLDGTRYDDLKVDLVRCCI